MTHRKSRTFRSLLSPLSSGCCLLASLLFATPVDAKPHEARIRLHDGKVVLSDLSAPLCEGLGIKPISVPVGKLDLSGLKGSNFVAAIDEALGDGCRVTISPDLLILHVDTAKLPKNCDAAKRAVRLFTAIEAPEATAAQRLHYGLHLPERIDPARPMIVLVHGLDSSQFMWGSIAGDLAEAGFQVAFFAYPSDGPLDDSATMLSRRLAEFRTNYPQTKVDLVCHSMGGLVARASIEGPQYTGGVDHLILLGTPNAGSTWAKYRLALEAQEQYHLWQTDPNWSPTWMITDGLGEAARDMKPGSKFLKHLNSQPRRPQVKYTIVAGNEHVVGRIGAEWLDCTAGCFPNFLSNWWGFRQCRECLQDKAQSVRNTESDSDGPVRIKSAKLAGVPDFVVVHADHASLICGPTPAAWPTIRDRLAK